MSKIALVKIHPDLNMALPQLTGDLTRAGHFARMFFFKDYDYKNEYMDSRFSQDRSRDLPKSEQFEFGPVYEALAEKLAEEAARANAGYPAWVARALMLLSDLRFAANDLLNARAILEAIVENFTADETIRTEAEKKLALVKAEEDRQSRIKPEGGDTLELQPNPKKD